MCRFRRVEFAVFRHHHFVVWCFDVKGVSSPVIEEDRVDGTITRFEVVFGVALDSRCYILFAKVIDSLLIVVSIMALTLVFRHMHAKRGKFNRLMMWTVPGELV